MLFAAGVRFQSTLPRVERPLYSRYRPAPSHFNPRSREWSDNMLSVVVYDIPAISIHAPASGATDNRIRELALSIISIHAPASGATGPEW